MILYFSGTGNSEYIARRIGRNIHDEVINVSDKIRKKDFSSLRSKTPYIVVSPTYAWRIPRILHEWLKAVELSHNQDIYFIMTCGGNIGNAGKYLKHLCQLKNINYLGCYPIVMPENYIAMFSTPTKEDAFITINQANKEATKAIDFIKNKKMFPHFQLTIKDRFNSSLVNDLFYPLYVHAKKFYVKENCIGCKKCEQMCPLHNISLEENKPVWKNNCTHCMACISHCPVEAIEYGKQSQGQPRYTCPQE